jgi:hypothetical protein
MAAFDQYPSVQEQLDPADKSGRTRGSVTTTRSLILYIPLMILVVASIAAPIAGFATLMGDRFGLTRPDPARTIPAAGIIFALSLPLLTISFVRWLLSRLPKDGIRQYQSGIALILGALSAVVIQSRGSAASVASWPLWMIPVLVVTVMGGIFFALLWRSARRARAKKPARSEVTTSYGVAAAKRLERVNSQIARLSDRQRAAISADLAAAIRDLARRGVITPADGDWAIGAELGKLALRMSQCRKRA